MPSRQRVLVVGSANADFIMQLPRLPEVGETVTDGRFLQTFGGKGANQAVAAARASGAGGRVTFLACVGRDAFGDQMIANFEADGIGTSRVARADDEPSGSALVMFDERGRNYLAVAPGSNYRLTPAHVEAAEDVIREAAVVVLQNEVPPETNDAAVRLAARAGVPVVANHAPTRGLPLPGGGKVAVLVVNEQEAGDLLGGRAVTADNAEAAADELRGHGPEVVVITLGGDGAVAASDAGSVRVASLPVQAVDTTAAGDTFCGALAVALVEGGFDRLADAMHFASAAAGLCCAGMGAQPSIPMRDAIDARIARNA